MNYQDKSTIRKVFYTVLVVFVSLVLSHIPVYGIKSDILSGVFSDRSMLSFTDILSGGSLSQLAVGGFGVTSMITASIVVQLAGVIFPKIEKYRSDGETGRRLFDKIELLMAVAITLFVSLVITVVGSNYYELDGFMKAIPVIEWLIGTVVIVKFAQSVQDHGIGNGQTLILAANIASRVPAEIVKRVVSEQPISSILILSAVMLITIVFAILLQSGFVSVKIQQTNKPVSIMNSEGIIPVPVSMSSVLPLIYASAIVSVPALISSFTGKEDGILGYIMLFTTQSYWYNPSTWQNVVGFAVYILLVFLFSVYASKLSFSAPDIANRMRERGDVIPGVRPGEETEQYLDKRRRKLSIISAVLIIIIAILPDFVFAKLGITGFSFMGTSLIILMAAFYDLRLRITGLLKQHNKKYSLFREV
jgi:preprotein translocase, SecY subunit